MQSKSGKTVSTRLAGVIRGFACFPSVWKSARGTVWREQNGEQEPNPACVQPGKYEKKVL